MGPKLSEQVCFAFYSTSRAITQAYKPLLDPLNLTYPQYVVMMSLWESEAVKITDIAEMTGITNATLSPLLKRLEVNGYIERRIEENDERQKLIVLTKSGRALGRKAQKAAELAFCATGLTDKEAQKLFKLCANIKQNLAG